jgi:hypothetical protein
MPGDLLLMHAACAGATSAATQKKAMKLHGCCIACLQDSSGEDSLAGNPVGAMLLWRSAFGVGLPGIPHSGLFHHEDKEAYHVAI